MFVRTLGVLTEVPDVRSRGVTHDRPDERNRCRVREFHSGIWAVDLDQFDVYVTDDYVDIDPNVPGDLLWFEEFREFIGGFQVSMSDIERTIAVFTP